MPQIHMPLQSLYNMFPFSQSTKAWVGYDYLRGYVTILGCPAAIKQFLGESIELLQIASPSRVAGQNSAYFDHKCQGRRIFLKRKPLHDYNKAKKHHNVTHKHR